MHTNLILLEANMRMYIEMVIYFDNLPTIS